MLPNPHIHTSLLIMALDFSVPPFCPVWYPSADLKRGRRWKAVKTRLLRSWNFMNLCQQSPTLSLNFWNVIKRLFLAFFSPSPPFAFTPNRWQMWRSLVIWAFSCWAGKMEASAHFLQNPKNSSSSQLVPITWKTRRKKGKKGCLGRQRRPKQLPDTGPSQKLITAFHLLSFSFSYVLPVFLFFSNKRVVRRSGATVLDISSVWREVRLRFMPHLCPSFLL